MSANRGYGSDDLSVFATLRKPFDLEPLIGTLQRALGSAGWAA